MCHDSYACPTLCIFRESSGERNFRDELHRRQNNNAHVILLDVGHQSFIFMYTLTIFTRLQNELCRSRDTVFCLLLFCTTSAIINFMTQLLEINDVSRPHDS